MNALSDTPLSIAWDDPHFVIPIGGERWWCDNTAAVLLRDDMPPALAWDAATLEPWPLPKVVEALDNLAAQPEADPMLMPRLAPLLRLGTPVPVLVDWLLPAVALYDGDRLVGLLMSTRKNGAEHGARPLSAWMGVTP